MAAKTSNSDAPIVLYVQLLNEGTFVARPTMGRPVGNGLYELLATDDYGKVDEEWEFAPGSIVAVIERKGDKGIYLLAVDSHAR